jgi:hypothetical protein
VEKLPLVLRLDQCKSKNSQKSRETVPLREKCGEGAETLSVELFIRSSPVFDLNLSRREPAETLFHL